MKRTPEAQVVTKVWENALPENSEMQRHGSVTYKDRYFQRLRFFKLLLLPVICVCPIKLNY